MAAALLLSSLEHPGSERACKRCIKQVLDTVAERLGHTAAICKSSYIHPRLLEDFTADRMARTLAPLVRRRLRKRPRDVIAVESLRAIEPAVARYLATKIRRRA
jgi:DNA topoisomerase IB